MSPLAATVRPVVTLPNMLTATLFILMQTASLHSPAMAETNPVDAKPALRMEPFSVPDHSQVGVLIDLSEGPTETSRRAITLSVSVSENGELLHESTDVDVARSKTVIRFKLAGDSGGRKLEFTCLVTTEDGKQVRQSVDYQVPQQPEWLGHFEVPEDFVPRPWPELKLEEDTTIVCWGRRYVFGASPFPTQILAGEQDVLSKPVGLKIVSGDSKLQWNGESIHIEKQSPAEVVLSRSGHVSGIEVMVHTTIEFDGFVWSIVRLTPQSPTRLDRVEATIPLHDDVAKYFHVDGKWAEKRWGLVRERDAFPASLDERHYYWTGNDDRGLCWMTDGLLKFQPAKDGQPRVGFRRSQGGYEGFFLPWSEQDMLSEPFEFRFGLQATPTRPPYHRPVRAHTMHNTPPERFPYPVKTTVKSVTEVSLQGKFNHPPYERDAEKIKGWIDGFHARGISFLSYQYISGEIGTEDYKRYWGDWVVAMPPERVIDRSHDLERGRGWTDMCLNSSYSDYYLHGIDIMTREFGADGVYLDGTIQERICQRGDIHGSECDHVWPLLASRQHLKKLRYLVQHNRGEDAFLWGHTSDIKIGPLISLMDLLFEGENYGLPHSYDAMTPAVLRSQFGRQWGPRTVIMPQITKQDRHKIPPSRFLGTIALHGIDTSSGFLPPEARTNLVFPLWDAVDEFTLIGATYRGYYEQETFIEESGLPVSMYLTPAGDRCLLVVANQTDDEAAYWLRYNADQVGHSALLIKASERLSRRPIPCTDDRLEIELGPWEFALLDVLLE